jgi:hypothetical protein
MAALNPNLALGRHTTGAARREATVPRYIVWRSQSSAAAGSHKRGPFHFSHPDRAAASSNPRWFDDNETRHSAARAEAGLVEA